MKTDKAFFSGKLWITSSTTGGAEERTTELWVGEGEQELETSKLKNINEDGIFWC